MKVVEAGGIEPPSENGPPATSTGLGQVLVLALGIAPVQAAPRPVRLCLALTPDEQRNQRQPEVSSLLSAYQAMGRRNAGCLKQPGRIRDRWQLNACCVFYEASQHLGLQPWFHHPRRNQGAPDREIPL